MHNKILITLTDQKYDHQQIKEAELALIQAYQKLVDADQTPQCFWSFLPAGQSFVAGVEADIYVVLVEIGVDMTQNDRERGLLEFNRAFATAFNLSQEKPLITFADSEKIAEYLTGARNRLASWQRFKHGLSTLVYAKRSLANTGVRQIRTNL